MWIMTNTGYVGSLACRKNGCALLTAHHLSNGALTHMERGPEIRRRGSMSFKTTARLGFPALGSFLKQRATIKPPVGLTVAHWLSKEEHST